MTTNKMHNYVKKRKTGYACICTYANISGYYPIYTVIM